MTHYGLSAAVVAALVGATLLTSGCASPSTPVTPGDGPPASVEVLGQGTVIQSGNAAPQFCLGAVAESYPPQCSGPELVGWDWQRFEGFESAGDVTWGAYAVWGEWDDTTLTVTDAVMLALYDPAPVVDPARDPANAGTTSEADLAVVQELVIANAPVEVLTSTVENGYVFVYVVHDDGSVQQWADASYGVDVVQVRSALVEI
jgi:hypothetical protein